MSGNITGLEVVISGIIKRRIAIFLLYYFLCGYFFSGAGRLFLGGTVDYFLCSLVRKRVT